MLTEYNKILLYFTSVKLVSFLRAGRNAIVDFETWSRKIDYFYLIHTVNSNRLNNEI